MKRFNHRSFYSHLYTEVTIVESALLMFEKKGFKICNVRKTISDFWKPFQKDFKKMQCQENPGKNLEDENHKKHRRLFSRVDYIAGGNVRDRHGKFKYGLWVDDNDENN